ncbi:MAG: hypothetical protein R2722_04715 [Tessaracoccus sp.]
MTALVELREASVTYQRGGRSFTALEKARSRDPNPENGWASLGDPARARRRWPGSSWDCWRPTAEGDVLFRGYSSSAGGNATWSLRSSASLVFQDPNSSLDPRMRIGDIITEPFAVGRWPVLEQGRLCEGVPRGWWPRRWKAWSLEAAHARRFPHQLSGERQPARGHRRALIGNPSLLVADEPVSALDVSVRASAEPADPRLPSGSWRWS